MISKLIFLIKRKKKYNNFHKKYKFSQNQITEILHKVKYNLPEFFAPNFSTTTFDNLGLDLSASIYVEFAKNLNFNYAKNLWLAKKIYNFSLIVVYKKENVLSLKKFLKFAKFLELNMLSVEVKNLLFSCNVNKKNLDNFVLKTTPLLQVENYYKIKSTYKNFVYSSLYKNLENYLEVKQFFYNGNYYFFNKINKNNQKINIFIKKILNFNYFLIKNNKNKLIIENLINNKQYYYHIENAKLNYKICKTKDGKSVVLLLSITITKEVENAFLYFGNDSKYLCNQKEILINIKNQFNYKIYTENNKINYFFNYFLPKILNLKLIFNNFKIKNFVEKNYSIEEIYWLYKTKKINELMAYVFFKKSMFEVVGENIVFKTKFNKNFILDLYLCGKQKQLTFNTSKSPKIIVGNTIYKNCNSISYELLEKESKFNIYM